MILLGGQNLRLSVMLSRKKPRNGIGTLKEALLGLWVEDGGGDQGTHTEGTDLFITFFLSPRSINVPPLRSSFLSFSKRDLWVKVRLERPWCGNSSDTPEPVLSSHLLPFFLVSLGQETFPLLAFLLRKVFICFKGPGIICHELSKIMETKQEVKQGWWNQSLFGCHLSFLILLLELSSKQSLRRVCHG